MQSWRLLFVQTRPGEILLSFLRFRGEMGGWMEGRRRRRHDVFINGRYDDQTAPNWTMIYLISSVLFGAGNVSA